MFGIDKNGLSLKDFIDQNHQLLSTMAVLIAIATYADSLPVQWLGNTILFLSTAGVVTVWFELYRCLPKTGTLRLVVFKNIITIGLIGFTFYWFLSFPAFWNIFSFIPLFLFLYYMFHTTIKQLMEFGFVMKIFGTKGQRNGWQKLLVFIYGFGIFVALSWMLHISIGAAPGINLMLELVRLNFH